MRFEYIVLLIIAFNVITAVMQRRAKKARAEAQQRAAGQSGGAGRQSAPRPFEDEVEEDEEWGEEYRDPHADRDPVPTTTSRRAGRDAATGGGVSRGNGDEPMQMPSMGRDILDQLARDLGLKLPKPAVPRPVESRPAPVAADTSATRNARVDAATRAVTGHPASQARPVSAIVRVDEAARSRTASGSTPLRLNLSGPERLREAFVLKEILDLPVSRRRRA